jgi:hypothetical protein
MKVKAKIIAFYLPQFHPIPENDTWWGKGFTEWTNVGKAKPLFKGHFQPRVPADLGYYDLRVSETRKAQADMAREHGIEGFCYWHYWFGNGKKLLERPFQEVLNTKDPDFPFCLAWANESWKGFDHGLKDRKILIEQLYPGVEDYKNHFYHVLPAFRDDRYIKINGKPIFMIYKPLSHPDVKIFIETWRNLAKENGFKDIHFVGHLNDLNRNISEVFNVGVDAVNPTRITNYTMFHRSLFQRSFEFLRRKIFKTPMRYPYNLMAKYFLNEIEDSNENVYPSIIPGWDHTPRSGKDGLVITDSSPELFLLHVSKAVKLVENKMEDNKLIFLKSWNEWAEGNYVEPDITSGKQYLLAIKSAVQI